MAQPHWALKNIIYEVTATGVEIKVWTFQPCHLWLRWTLTYPQEHIIPVISRGVAIHSDKRFCFVTYHDNEQAEGDDTYVHTFLKEPWPVCQTRFFYFHGRMGSERSPSTSAIFRFHRTQPPITATFYPDAHPEVTSVDGHVGHRPPYPYLTWAALRNAPGSLADDALTADEVSFIASSWDVGKWSLLLRGIQLYDTSPLGAGAAIISATLSIRGSGKRDELNTAPDLVVVSSSPASNTSLVPADFTMLGSTPLSQVMSYADYDAAGRNIFTLNPAGLAAINPTGITKLGFREYTHDVLGNEPNFILGKQVIFTWTSADWGDPNKPELTITYEPG